MTIVRPMFPPRAESPDSFPAQPATGQPETAERTSESRKPFGGLSRRGMIAGLAVLPAAVPAAASTVGADAELIALGKQLEPLVDAYYVAREVWAPALWERNRELDRRFGLPADRSYQYPLGYEAAAKEIDDRVGLHDACERLDALAQEISPIANAILALPVTSIEGLRAKAMVAFREVAPLSAGDLEYDFDDTPVFQRLFQAVVQVCGLGDKVAATGYVLPWPEVDSDYTGGDDDGDEA